MIQNYQNGKLRIKKWGRIKLNYELKMRGVKKFIIDGEINKISERDYYDYLTNFQLIKSKL